jgi:opacity protein-like surface antigen
MNKLALTSAIGLIATLGLAAQEIPHFTFNAGGGFTVPVGTTGSHLDTGWNAGIGGGYNFNNRVGALLQFNYNDLGINSGTLANIGVPGGSDSIWSLTLNPIVHLTPRSKADVYVIGGGGLYHRNYEFTAPTVATVTGFDPFLGFFPYNIAANQVIASESLNKPGFNVGVGVALGTKWNAKFYAEARYNRMFLGDYHADYMPVTFGVRW